LVFPDFFAAAFSSFFLVGADAYEAFFLPTEV
jgi:hypothetical protein